MSFVALKGIEVGGEFFPPGSVIEAIPAEAVAWLLEAEAIEAIHSAAEKPAKKKGGK